MNKELNAVADELRSFYDSITAAEEKAFRAACKIQGWDENTWNDIWETWKWDEHYTDDKTEFRENFSKFIKEYELVCEYELLKSQYEEAGIPFPK